MASLGHNELRLLVLQQMDVKMWHSLSAEDLVKIPPSFYVALGLDHWEFASNGNVPQHDEGSVSVGISSPDTCKMETLTERFGSLYLVRIPRTALVGISKDLPITAAFIPAIDVPTTILKLLSSLTWRRVWNTTHQTRQVIGICRPLFRNYWFDYRETFHKLGKGVSFEISTFP